MNAAGLGPARTSALLSAAKPLPLPSFHNNLETSRLFPSLLDLVMIDAQWKPNITSAKQSAVTAELNGFAFPKQAVCTTGSAASPEIVGILLSVDINSSFSSLFPIKSFSSDKRAADRKGQF